MDESFTKKLSAENSQNLITYLKLLKTLKNSAAPKIHESNDDEDNFNDMTDDELKQLAQKPTTRSK